MTFNGQAMSTLCRKAFIEGSWRERDIVKKPDKGVNEQTINLHSFVKQFV